MIIKLSKAIEFNGKGIKELDLNLDALTGQDLINAEESLRNKGIVTTGAADFSRNYVLSVCSQALKIAPEALMQLSARDFTKMMNEALIFLAGSDSEAESESKSVKK